MRAPGTAFIVVLLSLLMLGCATPDTQLAAPGALPDFGDSSRFGTRPAIPTPEALHRLTSEQEADFLGYFHSPSRAYLGAHERIVRYLEKITTGFQYEGDTLSAAETWATNSGNCLSLAILTTALTQLAGIEIGYQLMDDQPVFEYQGNVVRKGVHISSIVYNPDWRKEAGNAGQFGTALAVKIDYFPSLKGRYIDNLSAEEYLAMYYSNIAADAIAANDYGTAYWYLLEAMQHVPDHGVSLNMLAVINRRVGDLGLAQSYYAEGRLRNAETALRDAAEFANKTSTRTLYEAKLATLRQEF